MDSPDLHVVAFAVPFPPDYGGAIEVFNRLKALHESGARINLHCFVYGRFMAQDALKEITQDIHYYPRTLWPILFTRGQPFAVTSRKNKGLLERLKADSLPILFEGMQTTAWIDELKGRKLLLRSHNIEHQYYRKLAEHSRGLVSMMFNREAQCLEEYEQAHANSFDAVFTISQADTAWFQQHGSKAQFLPPFHGLRETDILTGRGDYLLYQGDLSIEINQQSLLELIRLLAPLSNIPMIVAGRAGDAPFESKIRSFPNIRREMNVSNAKMTELIRHAQVILVHSLHAEGMKLKLFPALFQGRFIAANALSKTHTGLDQAIHFYSPDNVVGLISGLFARSVTTADIEARRAVISRHPSDLENAKQILRYL